MGSPHTPNLTPAKWATSKRWKAELTSVVLVIAYRDSLLSTVKHHPHSNHWISTWLGDWKGSISSQICTASWAWTDSNVSAKMHTINKWLRPLLKAQINKIQQSWESPQFLVVSLVWLRSPPVCAACVSHHALISHRSSSFHRQMTDLHCPDSPANQSLPCCAVTTLIRCRHCPVAWQSHAIDQRASLVNI